jgi:glycosyltransferase involved in cell wall biosynthesis
MKFLLFANTDWYLYNFRRELALALRTRGDEVVLLSPPGVYVERLKTLGFRWVAFPLTRQGMNPFVEVATLWRLYKLYQKEKPDIAHHFTIKCVLYGSLAAHLAGVKGIVNSITGLGYIFIAGGIIKKILRAFILIWYRLVLKNTQAIFENDDDRQVFLQNNLINAADAYCVTGVGISTKRFMYVPEPSGEPVVLLASRMLWDKGVGEFVEAAKLLRSEGTKVRFALSGRVDEGNPASISQEQIEAWKDAGIVEWWGWSNDVPSLLGKVNIVCLPSYREGLPTVLMEAASCGRAIVTTDVPGCRETVSDGVTGFLVKVRDVHSLTAVLRKLIINPVLRQEMGRAGRALAEQKFTSEKILLEIFNVYARVAERFSLE